MYGYGYDGRSHHRHHHYDDDDCDDDDDDEDSEAYEGLFIGAPGKQHHGEEEEDCDDIPKTVTDIEARLEFVTMTKEADEGVVCPLFIVPW